MVFCSDRGGNFEIYHLANGVTTALTSDPMFDSWWPRQSPDGRTLLFYRSLVTDRPPSGGANNNYDNAALWSLDLNTNVLVERIPKDTGGWIAQGVADWAPDSQPRMHLCRCVASAWPSCWTMCRPWQRT
ncbi:MAG: hypothetical protein R3F17_07840 [Planctomycetota bacterium]